MNKNILKTFIILLMIIFTFSSCVVKSRSYSKYYNDCNVTSKKWELDYDFYIDSSVCRGSIEPLSCLAVLGVAVPVFSTVVSGSIVLIGNSVHWLEYQSKCDD